MLLQLILAIGVPVSDGQWPQELAVPTVEEVKAYSRTRSDGSVFYERDHSTIYLYEGVSYDKSARTKLTAFASTSSLPVRYRPGSHFIHMNVQLMSNGYSRLTATYGLMNAGRISVTIWSKESVAEIEEWMARPASGGSVLAVRKRHPGVDIGDDHFFLSGHDSVFSLNFQVGRYVVDVDGVVDNKTPVESQLLELGRVFEFRMYANGQLGDYAQEFTLSDGRKIKGVRSPQKYVPLKNIEKLGVSVTSHIPSGPSHLMVQPRYAVLKLGDKTVKLTEFMESLEDNGEAKPCPPAIPYDGDLWVPLTETLQALGLQERYESWRLNLPSQRSSNISTELSEQKCCTQ